MTKALRFLAALLVALPAFAQAQQMRSQAELDQMLAPVALYPDPLLSQVLMAATYPEEVSEAARWSSASTGLQGDDAVRAVEYEDWDPSVKSLVAFPQILARMAETPAWTQSLGDAFLAQEPQVMDTVQQLRRRAQAAGNLRSSEQMYVQQQGRAILIQPASPQYVYVPYYDPFVVYGPWWWSAYRPVYWAPWRPYAIRISLGFFFGNFDWHQRHVRVVHPNVFYYQQAFSANRISVIAPQRWHHEPQRREAFTALQATRPSTVQSQPARTLQSQPAATARVQPEYRPVAQQPRFARREEWREARPAGRAQVQPAANLQSQQATTVRVQPQVRQEHRLPAARAQATPLAQTPQVQPQAKMPPAVAQQQPRAERQERQELRREPRNEHGPKGRERS